MANSFSKSTNIIFGYYFLNKTTTQLNSEGLQGVSATLSQCGLPSEGGRNRGKYSHTAQTAAPEATLPLIQDWVNKKRKGFSDFEQFLGISQIQSSNASESREQIKTRPQSDAPGPGDTTSGEASKIYEHATFGSPASGKRENSATLGATGIPHQIFLVHGRDEMKAIYIKGVIERMTGIPVVILAKQPHRGAALIDKLEYAISSTDFGVVIFEQEDVGVLATDYSSLNDKAMEGRARQNVILEAGYLMGKLGRQRMILLVGEGVRVPSDIYGVGYIQIGSNSHLNGGWVNEMGKEFEAVGVKCNYNPDIYG